MILLKCAFKVNSRIGKQSNERQRCGSTKYFEDIGKNSRMEKSIDDIRKKYGFGALRRGITMGTVFTCDAKEVEEDFIPFDKSQKQMARIKLSLSGQKIFRQIFYCNIGYYAG